MADEQLFMRLFSQHPMADPWVDGGAVVDAFEELVPEWAPRVWGHDDPPRQRYQRDDLPSVWWSGDTFSWKGQRKGKPEAIVRLRDLPETVHTEITVIGEAVSVDPARTVALMRRLVERFGVDYGYVHVVTPADQVDSHPDSAYISPVDGPWMAASAKMLRTGLPNLWWVNVFGPAVVEVLGAARIATAPTQAVEEVADDTWLVQLTNSPLDAVTDPDRFAAVRSAVKAHLGFDAFWDPSAGKAGRYRAAQLPMPGQPPSTATMVVYGPAGFTQKREVRAVWQPFATEKTPGVWRLEGLDSRTLISLVESMPEANRTDQVNAIPTLDRFASLARRHGDLTFSGTLASANGGTEGLTIDTLWVPDDVTDDEIDALADDADDDEKVAGGRALWWD